MGGVNPKLHHGTLNAVFLPAVVKFNANAPSLSKDQRLQRMASAMGISTSSHTQAAVAVACAIKEMNQALGLPSGLSQMGVKEEWFEKIIAGAMADHCHKTNPLIATESDYIRMLSESM